MCAYSETDELLPESMASVVSEQEDSAKSTCPLSIRQQHRHLLRFAFHMSLIYLAAPVVYVGNLDAVLLKKLRHSEWNGFWLARVLCLSFLRRVNV